MTGFVAVIAKGGERAEGPGRPAARRDPGRRPADQAAQGGEGEGEGDKETLLAIGDDSMGAEEFARAVYHCGDLKTWDGMCSVSQVVRVR